MAALRYMGDAPPELQEVADAVLLVEGQRLPCHTTILGQHAPVLLGLCSTGRSGQQGDVLAGPIELRTPFNQFSLAAVYLFLRCCYTRHKLPQHISLVLAADPSGAAVPQFLRLCHMLGATGLLAAAAAPLCDAAQAAGGLPGSAWGWVAAAEACGLDELLTLLCTQLAERLAEAASDERKGLVQEALAGGGADVGAETLARIFSISLGASRRCSPIVWTVENIRSRTETVVSPSFQAGLYRWRVLLHPQGRQGTNASRPGYVAADLELLGAGLPAGWRVQACTRVELTNSKDPALAIKMKDEVPETYTEEQPSKGWKHLIRRADMEDASLGFLRPNGSIVIQVAVEPELRFSPFLLS